MSSIETMSAWARETTVEELSPRLRGVAEAARARPGPGERLLLLPAFVRGRVDARRASALIDRGERLVLLAPGGDLSRRVELALADVHTVEWATVLLHSWLRLDAIGQEGPVTLRVDFNTVSERLLRPVLERSLAIFHQGGSGDPEVERRAFDRLILTDYKFMNLGRAAVFPGARVQGFVLQRRLTRRRLRLLERTLAPGALLLLTDRTVATLTEGESQGEGAYAGILTWARRDRVRGVELGSPSGEPDLRTVRVDLPGERALTFRHEEAHRGQVAELLGPLVDGEGPRRPDRWTRAEGPRLASPGAAAPGGEPPPSRRTLAEASLFPRVSGSRPSRRGRRGACR